MHIYIYTLFAILTGLSVVVSVRVRVWMWVCVVSVVCVVWVGCGCIYSMTSEAHNITEILIVWYNSCPCEWSLFITKSPKTKSKWWIQTKKGNCQIKVPSSKLNWARNCFIYLKNMSALLLNSISQTCQIKNVKIRSTANCQLHDNYAKQKSAAKNKFILWTTYNRMYKQTICTARHAKANNKQ